MVGLALGFSLLGACGYSLARAAGSRPRWAAAVLYAHLAVFLVVFALQLAGLRITTVSCSLGLALITVGMWPLWKEGVEEKRLRFPAMRPASWIVAAMSGLTVYVAVFAPLQGWDTSWRWDYLGRHIAEIGTFSFYPPRSADDFTHFFYVDGFAPLISSVYAYLYLMNGRAVGTITAIPVFLQWCATLSLTAAAARSVNEKAGPFATAALACSGLFFWSMAIGQETGLTALATAAAVAAAVSQNPTRLAIALPLATLPLCRDYGPGLAVAGSVMVLTLQRRRRWIVLQGIGLAVGLSLPWFIRNWMLTGSPLYSNPVFGLPINPVHGKIITYCTSWFSPRRWDAATASRLAWEFVRGCGPAVILLIPAAAVLFHRGHRRMVVALGVMTLASMGIFWNSIPFTGGGPSYAMRVITPAVVAAAVLVGVWAAGVWQRGRWRKVLVVMAAVFFASGLHDAVLRSVPAVHEGWRGVFILRPSPFEAMSASPDLLAAIGPSKRVLSDDAELRLRLAPHGVEVVPIWSPEVAFLFDPAVPLPDAWSRLQTMGITRIAMNHADDPAAYSTRALIDTPFVHEINRRLPPASRDGNTFIWIVPQSGNQPSSNQPSSNQPSSN